MNLRRVICGGILAAAVSDAGETVLNWRVLGDQWAAALGAFGRQPAAGLQFVVFSLLGFALGVVAVWPYAASRPRLGPGSRCGASRTRSLPSRGSVITTGQDARTLAPGIELVPWERVSTGEVELF